LLKSGLDIAIDAILRRFLSSCREESRIFLRMTDDRSPKILR
jgi:hypothetical protein